MDFNQPDIQRFLIDAIPGRFKNLSPAEFESFIAYLYQVDGYEVDQISKKSDQTAHLLARKDGLALVIRVFRNPPEQLIQKREVQEAISARDFYRADQSWIITTSGFSEEAKENAERSDIELWDWDALQSALSELFFEGKPYSEYAKPSLPGPSVVLAEPRLRLKAKWEAQEGVGSKWYNLLLIVSNPTPDHLYVHLDLPVLIDKQKNQISAENWADEEFVAGMIYAGASIRTNALFKSAKLGERPPGGKIVLTCHERDPAVTYHLEAKLKGEACYFIAYAFTRQSHEYELMTKYRDQVLYQNPAGRILIRCYYIFSPMFIFLAARNKFVSALIKVVAAKAINRATTYYQQHPE